MSTIAADIEEVLEKQFRSNKRMLAFMVPMFFVGLVFEISQLQSKISTTKMLLIYFVVLPYLLMFFCILPIVNYFKALRIIKEYSFNKIDSSWHFTTLSDRNYAIKELVTESEGTLKYLNYTFKVKIFNIGKRKYYFPIEKIV